MNKLNTPNKLVLARFGMSIIVVALLLSTQFINGFTFSIGDVEVSWMNVIALFVFLLASATDWLDGHLARKNNEVTTFGKFFDPLADKLLVNSVVIIFAAWSRIPIWMAIIFVGRDILVDGMRMAMSSKGVVMAASRWGKYKTAFQMVGLSILFIFYPEPNPGFDYNSIKHLYLIPMYIATFFSLLSGYQYIGKNIKEVLHG